MCFLIVIVKNWKSRCHSAHKRHTAIQQRQCKDNEFIESSSLAAKHLPHWEDLYPHPVHQNHVGLVQRKDISVSDFVSLAKPFINNKNFFLLAIKRMGVSLKKNVFKTTFLISRKKCIFAIANVDRFVMIATTRKNAKTLISHQSLIKSLRFNAI